MTHFAQSLQQHQNHQFILQVGFLAAGFLAAGFSASGIKVSSSGSKFSDILNVIPFNLYCLFLQRKRLCNLKQTLKLFEKTGGQLRVFNNHHVLNIGSGTFREIEGPGTNPYRVLFYVHTN